MKRTNDIKEVMTALEEGRTVYYELEQGKPVEIKGDIGLMELYLRSGHTFKQILFGNWMIEEKGE